jgi:glycosyltransferase involved in cell wall biosynthesis
MNETDIVLIVCTYNRADLLEEVIRSLLSQETGGKFNFQILIIDDASNDNTKCEVNKIIQSSNNRIKYFLADGKGIACARNKGIQNSKSEWIVFSDDDQIAEQNWLKELYEIAYEKRIDCVGGKRLLNLPGNKMNSLSLTVRKLLGEIDLGEIPRKCKRKEFPAAGNIMIKRKIIDTIGHFNESFSRGGEDIELAVRLRAAGLESWYAPKSIVRHIIPEYRLNEKYLLWCSRRVGDNFAFRDYFEWGLFRTVIASIVRIARSLLINLPLLSWNYLRGNRKGSLEQKCLIWRTAGYGAQVINLVLPVKIISKKYLSQLEFRKEREIFKED